MYRFVQTLNMCWFMSWRLSWIMCIPASFVQETKPLKSSFPVVLYERSSRQGQSIHSSRKRNHSAQSVKSLLLIQNLTHSIKSFHLYTVTYYTHLDLSAQCVQPCECARALPVNSLHPNPCQGTQSLECIKSAVQGQAPGLHLSIYHAFLNPWKRKWVFQVLLPWLGIGAVALQKLSAWKLSTNQQQKKKTAVLCV